MKKFTLFLQFLFLGLSLIAQPKADKMPIKLISKADHVFMGAEWSPTGDRIAFSSEKFNGIWVSDIDGRNLEQITSDMGAGFGFTWSLDGKTILARPVVVEDGKRYHQVKLYDLDSGKEKLLVNRSRSIRGLPVWTSGNQKVAIKEGNVKKEFMTGKSPLKSASGREKLVDFGGTLSTVAAASQVSNQVNFPEFKGRYVFNKSVSPNGEKVIFEVSGKGLYVSNVDGTELRHLGFGEHPSWMPDNRYVVVVQVKDDGYVVTQGDLYVVDTFTGEYSSLFSQPEFVALKPSVSPDGKKVLFDNAKDGAIYLLDLEK